MSEASPPAKSTKGSACAPRLRSLPAALRKRLEAARRLSREKRIPLFLVGGAVRDLFLSRPVHDLDLAVEGDALAFGRSLARRLKARARDHERFGTVTLDFEDGSRLDVAASRGESYEAPGKLPRVEPASIAQDLGRRDFTINAMALEIGPGRRARLHDPFGGRHDLDGKILRMIHSGSPRDDPTRAFRAARYSNRLGFSIEPRTRRWIREALASGAFDEVSGDRLRREIRLLFSEGDPAGAVGKTCGLGLTKAIHPRLPCDSRAISRLRRGELLTARDPEIARWLVSLLLWSAGFGRREADELAERLSLAGEEGRVVREWPDTAKALGAGEGPSSRTGRGLSAEEIAAARALFPPGRAKKALERRLAVFALKLTVRGRDLVEAGIPTGPRIGRALARTLSARREGRITRREELAFALAEARQEAS